MRLGMLLCAVLILSSCQAKQQASVTHVVVCWLKTPGDEGARQQLIDESYKFRKIPGVMSVTVGRAIPSDRPVVDSTFDVAVVIAFEDEKSLRAYENHPIHIQAANNVLRPLTAKVLVYDIERGLSRAQNEADADITPASKTPSGPQEQLFTPR